MPDISPESFIPDRERVTFGSAFRITALAAVGLMAIGGGGIMAYAGVLGLTGRVTVLYDLSQTLGINMFSDVRADFLASVLGGLILSPIVFVIGIAAIQKAFFRIAQQTDKELY